MAVSSMDGKTDKGLRTVLAEGVRVARARRRLSQQDVARSAGVGNKQMVKLEQGATVNIDTAERIVAALGLVVTVTESAA